MTADLHRDSRKSLRRHRKSHKTHDVCDWQDEGRRRRGSSPYRSSRVRRVLTENTALNERLSEQEKEIRRLRSALALTEEKMRSNAFKAFCDRLLMSNVIWNQEKAIQEAIVATKIQNVD